MPKFWVVLPTRKPNKVKLETQENKYNIFCVLVNRATLNMIVLKQANSPPVRCGVGFEVNDITYYSQSCTGKTPKLVILAHTPT